MMMMKGLADSEVSGANSRREKKLCNTIEKKKKLSDHCSHPARALGVSSRAPHSLHDPS